MLVVRQKDLVVARRAVSLLRLDHLLLGLEDLLQGALHEQDAVVKSILQWDSGKKRRHDLDRLPDNFWHPVVPSPKSGRASVFKVTLGIAAVGLAIVVGKDWVIGGVEHLHQHAGSTPGQTAHDHDRIIEFHGLGEAVVGLAG